VDEVLKLARLEECERWPSPIVWWASFQRGVHWRALAVPASLLLLMDDPFSCGRRHSPVQTLPKISFGAIGEAGHRKAVNVYYP